MRKRKRDTKNYKFSKNDKSSCDRGPELPLPGGGGGGVLTLLKGVALAVNEGAEGARNWGGGEVETGLEIG